MWLYQEVTEKYITEIYRKNIILKYKEKEGEGSDLGRFLFLLPILFWLYLMPAFLTTRNNYMYTKYCFKLFTAIRLNMVNKKKIV